MGAGRRLRQKTAFERLLRHGARRNLDGYTFYVGERDGSAGARLGLLVSRKHAPRATDRNYIKRCIREAFRMEQAALAGMDVLVRPPYGVKPSGQMILRLRKTLARLAKR